MQQDIDGCEEFIQATASEGLAQFPYMAARVGLESATLWTQSTELTTEPPCPQLQDKACLRSLKFLPRLNLYLLEFSKGRCCI